MATPVINDVTNGTCTSLCYPASHPCTKQLSEISSSAPAFGGPADNSSAASALGQRTAKGRYAMTPLPGSTQVRRRAALAAWTCFAAMPSQSSLAC